MVASEAAQAPVSFALAGQRAAVASVGRGRGPRHAVSRALAGARRAVAEAAREVAQPDVVAGLAVGVGTGVAGFWWGGQLGCVFGLREGEWGGELTAGAGGATRLSRLGG